MVFARALRRELTQSAVGVFVALLAVLLTTQLIRLLNEAAGGRVAPEGVVALLGFASLNYLPLLLSLTLFVTTLLTLSRHYRDSEMVIWFSSGLSLTRWVVPVLVFALPVVVAIALLSGFLSPWALGKSAEFRQKMSNRGETSQVAPGAFKEASSSERVVFVEAVEEDAGVVRNVFVNSVQNGRLGVIFAASGRHETAPNGDRFMVMEQGRRYEVTPGEFDAGVMAFERYAVRIETKEARTVEKTTRTATLRELLDGNTPVFQAELLWRIGVPLSALILPLLAIPLSFVNPRAGRSANLVLALVVFMIYSNLMSISQAWVAQGRASFSLAWWPVHASLLALAFIFILTRVYGPTRRRRVISR
jgi:lipopolysaccharide export system permease protein